MRETGRKFQKNRKIKDTSDSANSIEAAKHAETRPIRSCLFRPHGRSIALKRRNCVRWTSLALGFSIWTCYSRGSSVSAQKTHFLTGNLSSIVLSSEKSHEFQTIASDGKARQASIKTEVARAVKSVLQQQFHLTGHETILPTLDDIETDSMGRWHIRYKQYIDGLPVEGASVVAHVDPESGTLVAVNGEFHPDSPFEAKASSVDLDCEAAVEKALNEYGVTNGEWKSGCTATVVQGRDGKARRAFKRLLGYQPSGVDDPYQVDVIFADRATGTLVGVHPQVFGARSINTFDCRRREGRPSDCKVLSTSSDRIESKNKAAQDAHNFAVDIYDFYMTYFGRDSYDGKGATIRSYVNYGSFYNNAFYSSVFDGVVYGNGDRT
jgi:Zn-dependent metalloprotease